MARGGAIRRGLTLGLAAGVGAAVVRAARARRIAASSNGAPVWPPLPAALHDAPPLPPVEGHEAPAEAATTTPIEAVLEAEGTAALVAEAAVLEAEGVTEAAEVDTEAAAALRVRPEAADTEAVTWIADRFDEDEDRFMPLDSGFEDLSRLEADVIEDDLAEGDDEPAWGTDLDVGADAGEPRGRAAETRLLDDAVGGHIDRFMPLETGLRDDEHDREEPSAGSTGAGVGTEAPDEVDLEALVLAEEAALEAERLEAEQLELDRLATARSRAEEVHADQQAARQQERQDALARFAAQRDEAQRLLALQEERAARAQGEGGEARRPLMASDFNDLGDEEELRTAASLTTGEPEGLVTAEDEADAHRGADEVGPAAQLVEEDRLGLPVLQPMVPDEVVADLEEEPAWGVAVDEVAEPAADDERLEPVDVDTEPEADEGQRIAPSLDEVLDDTDEAEVPRAEAELLVEDEDEDLLEEQPVDHFWPDDDAVYDEVDEDEDDETWAPALGLHGATDEPDEAEDIGDIEDIEDEAIELPASEEAAGINGFGATLQTPEPPPPVAGGQPDSWAAWVKANPASWATSANEDEDHVEDVAVEEAAHQPWPDDEAELEPESVDQVDEEAEALDGEDEVLLQSEEPGWVPVGEPVGRRRPIMTGDFDDVPPEELLADEDEDEDERPQSVVTPPPRRAPALRRSGKPRVPLKARRVEGTEDEPEPVETVVSLEATKPVEPIAPTEPVDPVEPAEVVPVTAPPQAEPPVKKAPAAKKKAAPAKRAPAKKVMTKKAGVERKAPAAKRAASSKKAVPSTGAKKASSIKKGTAKAVVKPPTKAPKTPKTTKAANTTKAAKAAKAAKTSSRETSTPTKRTPKKKPDVLWVEPAGDTCPSSHPVKAIVSRGIFHVVGGRFYERSKPERCYRVAAAAEADGLRQAKR